MRYKRPLPNRRSPIKKDRVQLSEMPKITTSKQKTFYIIVDSKIVGFIKRGHRKITNEMFKSLGVYSAALEKLENMEKEVFSEGGFEQHRDNIAEDMERQLWPERLIDEVKGVKQPAYIDFTNRADVALLLMEKGYSPSMGGLRILENQGLQKGADRKQIMKKLEEVSHVFFVLTKPVS